MQSLNFCVLAAFLQKEILGEMYDIIAPAISLVPRSFRSWRKVLADVDDVGSCFCMVSIGCVLLIGGDISLSFDLRCAVGNEDCYGGLAVHFPQGSRSQRKMPTKGVSTETCNVRFDRQGILK